MRLTRRRKRAYQVVEAQAASVVRHLLPIYTEAVAASIRGRGDAEAWTKYERATLRAMVLVHLLGEANARRSMRLPPVEDQPPVEMPALATFAELEISGLMAGAFLDAINAFLRDIPDLADRVTVAVRNAAPRAQAMRVSEAAQAPAEFDRRLRKQIVQRMSQPGAAVSPVVSNEAVADAVMTTSGRKVAVNRMDTEYRTALLGSFNEGQRAQRIEHADRIPLQELVEIQDRRTRGNPAGLYPDASPHYQMHGFVAPVTDPIWNAITPPNGYNCRGTTRGIGWPEARRRGWAEGTTLKLDVLNRDMAKRRAMIDRGEYPDDGFRGPIRPAVLTGAADG